jgi:hypothetical protein
VRRTTTVVCTIGIAEEAVAEAAALGSNVAFEPSPSLPDDAVERMRASRSTVAAARRRNSIYTVITVDPLEPVVREWSARLRGEDNDLETVIGLAPAEPLPDYYLVSVDLVGDEVHWYLDHVYRSSDRRVLPIEPTTDALLHTLAHLPHGVELPNARDVAAGASDYVPPPDATVTKPSAVTPAV